MCVVCVHVYICVYVIRYFEQCDLLLIGSRFFLRSKRLKYLVIDFPILYTRIVLIKTRNAFANNRIMLNKIRFYYITPATLILSPLYIQGNVSGLPCVIFLLFLCSSEWKFSKLFYLTIQNSKKPWACKPSEQRISISV